MHSANVEEPRPSPESPMECGCRPDAAAAGWGALWAGVFAQLLLRRGCQLGWVGCDLNGRGGDFE